MTEDAPESQPASGPAREARRLLSGALERLQLRAGQTASVLKAVEHAANASSELYRIEVGEPGALDRIREAIEQLAQALELTQEHAPSDPAVVASSETFARTLALLYPVAQAHQRARKNVVFSDLGRRDGRPPSIPEAPPPGRPRIETPSFRGRELRSHGERVFVEADIGLTSHSHFYTGLSQDLSTGGVFIATYQPQPVGTLVGLYFVLPGGHVVEAQGVVRWARRASQAQPPGMGVAFEQLREADLEAIQRFCEERAPLYHTSADSEER
ncbi:MAG: TIGR02266 family protein [Polyangiaceae bacterium]|nr:TIGR02266 family protein [Polyangiaceae bacterium]MCW5790061.1 TIGR02266 family protein [Polyangiaceae bacterium]